MEELDEGGEMLFPGPEGDQDDDPSGGETVGWPVVATRSQHSGPGSVLLLQVQLSPAGGQGQLLVRPHHGGGAERQAGAGTCWLSIVLGACRICFVRKFCIF